MRATDSRTETLLLKLAVERGLLNENEVAALPGEDRGASPRGSGPPAGTRLRRLLQQGRLDERDLASLEDELVSQEITQVDVPWAPAGPGPRKRRASTPLASTPLRSRRHSVTVRDDLGPAATEGGELGVAGGVDWLQDTMTAPPLPPDADLSFLAGWDRYEIKSFLGAGGMGHVYRAFDPALKRQLALKFLRFNDRPQMERFLREARAQARIEHENVCKVFEVGQVGGRPYIAMQLVEGTTLIEAAELLTLEQKVRVVQQVAYGIHAAHRIGLVHRDLKPGNILLETRDDGSLHPYVVDFGLVHDQEAMVVTRSGAVTGTPAYLSPEQAQCTPVDRRSDVYSLGVVLYELLVGVLPLRGTSLAESLIKVVGEAPLPPTRHNPAIPRDLETIVLKALEKEPQRRYDSARAFAADLDRFLNGEPILARPPTLSYRLGKWVRRNQALAGVLAASSFVLLATAALSMRAQLRQAERARLLQRFTEEVSKVEADQRLAALLPKHDIRPHRDELAGRMQEIAREMDRLGELAAGPGHYALGRGYLALHREEEALEHLQKAWDLGYRSPEIAAGLGRTLAVLYQRTLLAEEPRGPRDRTEKPALAAPEPMIAADVARVDDVYREPALQYLANAASAEGVAPAEAAYLQAIDAFFRRRYDLASERIQQARALAPWLYEAHQLEAEVLVEEAEEHFQQGDYALALDRSRQAGEVYAALLEVARSDATLYAADCRRAVRAIAFELELARFNEAAAHWALARCDEALAIDADLAEAHTLKANLLSRWARYEVYFRHDPTPRLTTAIGEAAAAIALDPRQAEAHRYIGSASLVQARWQLDRGEDALPTLERALASANRALALQPALRSALLVRGNAAALVAETQAGGGLDPRQAVDTALAAYDQITRLNPFDPYPVNNSGKQLDLLASYELATGQDPLPTLQRALDAYRRAAELSPRNAFYQTNVCNAYLNRGDVLLRRDEDPSAELAKAKESCQKALEISTLHLNAFANLAAIGEASAGWEISQGKDPSASLKAGFAALAHYEEKGERDAFSSFQAARLHRLVGRWQERLGASPRAAYQRAHDAVEVGLAVNPRDTDLWLEAGELALVRARATGGGRGDRFLDDGRRAVEHLLALNPRHARGYALDGELLLMAAEGAASPAEATALAQRSAAAFEVAFGFNARLRRGLERAVEEARRRAGLTAP